MRLSFLKQACARKLSRRTAAQPCCSEPRQTPLTKRANYPNLLRRPHAPAAGRGRLQIQIRRAFVVREVLTSSEIYDSCYARRRMLGQQIDRPYRWSVVRILRQVADPIGRTKPYGAVLWRLSPGTKKSPTEAGLKL